MNHSRKLTFLFSAIVFALLVYIAQFVNDTFVRPFLGDVIVVIWLYLFLKSFTTFGYIKLSLGVLAFAYTIEMAQYFNLVRALGLEHHAVVRIVLGATFDWLDMLAYTLGWLAVILGEQTLKRVRLQRT